MTKPKVLLDLTYIIHGRYRVVGKVLQVRMCRKFPDGIKARFVLIDLELGMPILLIDNHAPFGFHMHAALPFNDGDRVRIDVRDFSEAYEFFLDLVERVLNHEV